MTDEGDTTLSPEEAFSVLGDETRIEIIRALAETPGEATTFSELRERVGAEDSGGFNYHLSKLLDRFVRKTGDGYELTTAGSLVNGAILSGAYTGSESFEPVALTGPHDDCPSCGAKLEMRYADEEIAVACSSCDRMVVQSALPPGVVEGRPREQVPDVFNQYLRTLLDRTAAGICTDCLGPTDGTLTVEPAPEFDFDEPIALARFDCDRCGDRMHASPGALLLSHPAVVSFYDDHGIDVRSVPVWGLQVLRERNTDVIGEDPLRVRVTLERDGDQLALVLDDSLDVLDIDRSSPA